MAIFPVRTLHAEGIKRDPAPYSLDLNAFSAGANVRFHANFAERAPVFKTIASSVPTANPAFTAGVHTEVAGDYILTVGPGERLWQYSGGAFTEVTPTSGWKNFRASAAFNFTQLGDVVYINRPSQQPWYYGPGSSVFAALPGWNSTWTARSLRAYGDFLIALNVKKGANVFPNLVKGSDLALYGQPPGSWDQTDLTTSATENPLEQLTTPIVDGCPLRDGFVVYSEDQIWLMEQTGDELIFSFRRLFGEGGLIAPNCCVEVDGMHYVFGVNDLYQHDGVNKQSIFDGRNRSYVFNNLVRGQSEACFAAYLPMLDQVVFGYPTTNSDAAFQNPQYCNQAFVYDRVSGTGSFIDLPDTSQMSLAYNVNAPAWSTETNTWSSSTNTWSQLDGDNLGTLIGCSARSGGRLLAYDYANKGRLTLTAESGMNAAATLIRTGIDLDQLGANIVDYKLVKRLFPLVKTYGGTPLSIQVGSQLTPQGTVTWLPAVTFDPATQYKVDFLKGGRFLAIQVTQSAIADFEFAGFDVEMVPNGHR